MDDDGKIQDFAEVWVAANRSRAFSLMRYVSIVGTALGRRWEQHRGSAADRARSPVQLPPRSDMAIAESAVRSGGT
jgi:hypothetical protein